MAKQTMARPAAARAARPPRPASVSVPAFGGWEVDKEAAPDYSLDFTTIRAARMHRRTKALSWSSFVDANAAVAVAVAGETTTTTPGGEEEEERRQWSSAATSDADDDDDGQGRRQRHRTLRRLRSADDDDNRLPIQPARPSPKGRNKLFKGYLFGCVGGQW